MPNTKLERDDIQLMCELTTAAGLVAAYEPIAKERFDYFDRNKTGKLEKRGLGKVVKQYDQYWEETTLGKGKEKGVEYTEEEKGEFRVRKQLKKKLIAQFLEEYDENKDGEINYEEYRKGMKGVFKKMFLTKIKDNCNTTPQKSIEVLEKYKKHISEFLEINDVSQIQKILDEKFKDCETDDEKLYEVTTIQFTELPEENPLCAYFNMTQYLIEALEVKEGDYEANQIKYWFNCKEGYEKIKEVLFKFIDTIIEWMKDIKE